MDGVRVAEIPGKGRGLVAARPLRGGEVVLRDSPILLYGAGDDTDNANHCGHCFRTIEGDHQCSAAATQSAWARESLSLLRRRSSSLSAEQVVQARFLIAAYELRGRSPAQLETVMRLQGSPEAWSEEAARAIHAAVGLAEEDVGASSALLAKEMVNAFGLMEAGPCGERKVRAYGIYPAASALNHDCLPNACRFEYLESGTEMSVRMIHDVAEGSEVCLSYFPVSFRFRARQDRLREDYGFSCTCDRCRVEAEWQPSDDDDAVADNDLIDDAIADDSDDLDCNNDEMDVDMDDDDDDGSSFPHAYFFGMYMCQRPDCGGTLAPVDATTTVVVTMECSVCAHLSPLQR